MSKQLVHVRHELLGKRQHGSSNNKNLCQCLRIEQKCFEGVPVKKCAAACCCPAVCTVYMLPYTLEVSGSHRRFVAIHVVSSGDGGHPDI